MVLVKVPACDDRAWELFEAHATRGGAVRLSNVPFPSANISFKNNPGGRCVDYKRMARRWHPDKVTMTQFIDSDINDFNDVEDDN